jgi:hypothetical protein
MNYVGVSHCQDGCGKEIAFDIEDLQRIKKLKTLDPSSKWQRKFPLIRYQVQFRTAKELFAKDVLRSENNEVVVYSWDNSVQTTIELNGTGGLKFSQMTVNSSDKKEG